MLWSEGRELLMGEAAAMYIKTRNYYFRSDACSPQPDDGCSERHASLPGTEAMEPIMVSGVGYDYRSQVTVSIHTFDIG